MRPRTMVWALCLGIGLCSGFLAGLLGIGGGTVIVPSLILAAHRFGIGDGDAAPVAMATSLATVIPTSICSARAHAARGSVDWSAFRRLAPGIAAGALAGTLAACAAGSRVALLVFIGFALFAVRQLLGSAPVGGALPGAAAPASAVPHRHGLVIGLLSALAGVGGGLLSVPLLAHHLPMQRAIGTAAALGLPLAIAGLAGYLLAGRPAACAAGCFGYVLLPAVFTISLAAIAAAPLGASLAHRVPAQLLRRAFATLLLAVSAELAAGLLR